MNEFTVGSMVKFRGREWIVMPSLEKDILSLRPISGSEANACGVFLPLEAQEIEPAEFPLPTENDLGDFESARLLRDAARLLLRHGAGPFRSIGHLSFRPRPYQLVPLLMALRLEPIRMLIADDVGIGKTIEAGLIARELLDRGDIKRLAVLCPPYLCDQWQKELSGKFNIDAKIVRSSTLARLERDLPRTNLSVFEYYPHVVISIDFVKSQRRKDSFLIHAPDLVIIDEAHGCAKPAGQSVSQQQRHELISDLSKDSSKNILLVTATPHSGVEESFLSLLGFIKANFANIDLDQIESSSRENLAKHFVQRRRVDVIEWMGTKTRFPERESLEVSYLLSADYQKLFQDVYSFARELVIKEPGQKNFRKRVRYWTALALLRCVMSSPAAAQAALKARLERLVEKYEGLETDYSADIYDPTDLESIVDIVPSHVISDSQDSISSLEKRKLRELSNQVKSLNEESDAKINKAAEEIKALLKEGYKPIVFCRFIATADYVATELKNRLAKDYPALHVVSVTGSLSEEEREIQIEELSKSLIRVLVATDCLSEGINLQDRFNAVLHYDLPWNPNRLEQREGRVDRFGQKSDKVKAIILFGADNPIDGAVLEVLLRKAKTIHKTLKISVPIPVDSENVLEAVLKALFLKSGDQLQISLFDDKSEIAEVHRKWERAADREKKSRTLFAQHSIKPGEVALELEKTDHVLGSPDVVHRFVRSAMQRLNSPISPSNGHWKIDLNSLPPVLKTKLMDLKIKNISFEQPDQEDVSYITRNHALTNSLAEYLFERAFDSDGKPELAARSSVIRSDQVDKPTTFLLLRLRHLIQQVGREESLLAEECIVAGLKGLIGSHEWLKLEQAEKEFDLVIPSENISDGDKKYWLNQVVNQFKEIESHFHELAEKKALELSDSYERLRKATKSERVSIEPLLPVDVLALAVVLPKPRI